jgi:hypothetical protein
MKETVRAWLVAQPKTLFSLVHPEACGLLD